MHCMSIVAVSGAPHGVQLSCACVHMQWAAAACSECSNADAFGALLLESTQGRLELLGQTGHGQRIDCKVTGQHDDRTTTCCCQVYHLSCAKSAHTKERNTCVKDHPPHPQKTSSEPHPAKLLHDCYSCYCAAGLLLVLLLLVAVAAAARRAAEAWPAAVDGRRPLGCTLPHAQHSTRSTPDPHAARDAGKRRPTQPKPLLLLLVMAAASAAGGCCVVAAAASGGCCGGIRASCCLRHLCY
jgi:hypothetical protein